MKRIIALVVLAIASTTLSACAGSPTLVVMQNPKTGEVAQCRHDGQYFLPDDINNCVDGYKKAGWVNLTPDRDRP